MHNDLDSNQPSLDVILHTALGVVVAISLAVMVATPQVLTVVA
jgi:hypothetical protein